MVSRLHYSLLLNNNYYMLCVLTLGKESNKQKEHFITFY